MRLALIGHGNIGRTLLKLLERQPVEQLTVLTRPAAVASARTALQDSGAAESLGVTDDLDGLIAAGPDLVIECAGHAAARDLAPRVLLSGIDLVLVSVGALADDDVAAHLRAAAAEGGARLVLPAGAIGGIDLLSAIAPAGGISVTYRGTKPPAAWVGTPAEDRLDLATLTEARTFFRGTAREAARSYPRNANVAATLALAGPGFDATRVELTADPAARGNLHSYEVTSPICRFSMVIEGAGSADNAKTSVSTVYSVLREINRLRAPLVV